MDILRQGRHRGRGGDPDRVRAWRRRTATRIIRATGSRTGAALTFVVLAIVAWIAADVMVGEDTRSPARSEPPPANGASAPPLPPDAPALVAAAGPYPEIQAIPIPPPTSSPPAPTQAPASPPPPAPAPPPSTSPPAPEPPRSTAPPAANSRTAYARQYSLMVRSAPTQRADLVTTVPNNTAVTLVCHTTGPSVVSFTGRTTPTWSKIVTPDGSTGYVSDGWLLTSADVTTIVPAC